MAFDRDPRVIVRYGLFFNSRATTYTSYGVSVEIPPYESSDGPTLNFITKMFFTPREYVLGAPAALVHDYMCRHKSEYDRKIASKILRDIWISEGLNPIKGYLAYLCMDFYQWFKHRNEWKS